MEAPRRTQLRRGRPEEELSWLVGGAVVGFFLGGGGIDGGGGVGGRSRGESPGVLERGGVGGGGGGILEWEDFLSALLSLSWKRARNCGTPMRECGPRKRKKIEEIQCEIFFGERSN